MLGKEWMYRYFALKQKKIRFSVIENHGDSFRFNNKD